MVPIISATTRSLLALGATLTLLLAPGPTPICTDGNTFVRRVAPIVIYAADGSVLRMAPPVSCSLQLTTPTPAPCVPSLVRRCP